MDALEGRLVRLNHSLDGECPLDPFAIGGADRGGQVGVVEQSSHFLCETDRVAIGYGLPFGLAGEQLANAFHVGRHHRQTAGHRFEQHVGHSLPTRRQHQQSTGGQDLGHIGSQIEEVDPPGQPRLLG